MRPIDFGGWLGAPEEPLREAAQTLDFWLRYWCAAYGRALSEVGEIEADTVVFASYDATCARPLETLAGLRRRAGIGEPAGLDAR